METDAADKTIIALSLFIVTGITFFAIYNNWWNLGLFWDLGIYQRAAQDGLNGLDPYREVDGMAFVYHPLFLHLFSAIDSLISLQGVLALGYILTLGWFILEIQKFLKATLAAKYGTIPTFIMPVMVSMTPFAVGVTTMVTGNMTTYFHIALFAFLLRTLRQKDRFTTVGTMVLIGIFTAVKPYFLAYILLALLDKDSPRDKALRMTVATLVFVGIWASGLWIYPEEMQRFLHNIAGLQSSTRVDIGIGFYRIAYELGLSKLPALAVHLAVSAALLLWVWRGVKNMRKAPETQGFALALSYFALTLVNPRIKEYDLWPALMFIFIFWNAYSPKAKQVFLIFSVLFSIPILILIVTFLMGMPPGYDPIRG